MVIFKGPVRALLLTALGAAAAAGIAGTVSSALGGDTVTFTDAAGNDDHSWENPDNWDAGSVPDPDDDVIVPGGLETADVTTDQSINSLEFSSSVHVLEGADLTVANGITANGGYFTIDGTVHGEVFNNEYITNSGDVFGALTNTDTTLNGDRDMPNGATWTGDVLSNTAAIVNSGAWKGNVVTNDGGIDNDGAAAVWTGNVEGNSFEHYIQNLNGGTWNGDVDSNDGDILNQGLAWTGVVNGNTGRISNDTVWNGNVLSNDGSIVNRGIWNGSMVNGATGALELTGQVNGDIDNSGELFVPGVLSLAGDLTNSGLIRMNDDEQTGSNRIDAVSWTGDGTAYFELETALGRGDHVVLSGDYSANTVIHFEQVGATGRTLADIPVITVGGVNTGTITPDNLPGPGVISYDLVRSGESWLLTTTLNDAPDHAAAAAGLLSRTLGAATLIPLDRGDVCGRGGWVNGLGANQGTSIGGVDSTLDYSGAEAGFDLPCMTLGDDVTLGIGVMAGGLGGDLKQDLGPDSTLEGEFQHAVGGAYANLAAGPWHAVLQGQIGVTDLSFSDPGAAVEAATLRTFRYGLSGSASYTLALGDFSLAPELGFDASSTHSHSNDFADVGTMSLNADPALAAHVGATVAAKLDVADGMTLSPFATLSFHGDLLAPDQAEFVDGIGSTATVAADDSLGAYAELAVGADIVSAATARGGNIRAGVRGDLKRGDAIDARSLSGYANVKF